MVLDLRHVLVPEHEQVGHLLADLALGRRCFFPSMASNDLGLAQVPLVYDFLSLFVVEDWLHDLLLGKLVLVFAVKLAHKLLESPVCIESLLAKDVGHLQ